MQEMSQGGKINCQVTAVDKVNATGQDCTCVSGRLVSGAEEREVANLFFLFTESVLLEL